MTRKYETAIILAGGRSQRMGFDKAELEISGTRLVDQVYSKISRQCSTVLISGPRTYGLDVSNIFDSVTYPAGPVRAVFSSAAALQGRVSGFFTVPIDGPDLPDDLCNRLYSRHHSTIACDENGTHPTFAWWRLQDVIAARKHLKCRESMSLHELAAFCTARKMHWPGQTLFFNLNNKSDLVRYVNGRKT